MLDNSAFSPAPSSLFGFCRSLSLPPRLRDNRKSDVLAGERSVMSSLLTLAAADGTEFHGTEIYGRKSVTAVIFLPNYLKSNEH